MVFIENFFGTLAFITSFIGLIPQIYKSAKTRSTSDVSMVMLINYLICSICWIIYGLCQDSIFVILSNVVGCITSLISITQKYYYDKHKII
ncbi:MAG: hypothetical protein LBH99_01445 [Rickettsia sp.]|nr:hypothetical protein [Rickettsia sp.]